MFHTGQEPWRAPRTLAELIAGPEPLLAFVPEWQPLFWDLAERTPEELLQAAGQWLSALAMIRAERDDEELFREVFAAVLRRLEALSEMERVRWHDLLWFVLSWALRRRPSRERQDLMQIARDSQTEVAHREEIAQMSETIAQTWEQELLARGEIRGQIRGQLEAHRENLRVVLEERFGSLPAALVEQMEATEDPERLRAAFRQALHITSLSDLKL